jgi:uncharacterized membrane protein
MSPVYEGLLRALVWFLAIFALTAVGLAIERKLRGRTVRSELDPDELMTNFRELYDRGGLSDEEFRTIKAKLARQTRERATSSRTEKPGGETVST